MQPTRQSPVIIPVASPEVSSLEMSVELVRGAVSSTEQHNTAAPNLLQMIIGRLVSDLCPMFTHRHNPDILP